MPQAFQIIRISKKQSAIRYLTPNFGTPIRYRYEVSLFVRARTVSASFGIRLKQMDDEEFEEAFHIQKYDISMSSPYHIVSCSEHYKIL